MSRDRSTWVMLSLLSLAGALLFARGFFPVKPLLDGYSTPYGHTNESHPSIISHAARPGDGSDAYVPFDRLAFILVDALRSDFAFGPTSQMSFVHSLIDDNRALPFTALAQAPTVTLPRLKALTTGSNPTFLDAIMNLAEGTAPVLQNVDSWVRQLALGDEAADRKPKKVVFAGDDTWLRMFPEEWFSWAEGVSSFFVSESTFLQDTVNVDTNVTRHLDALLSPTSSSTKSPPADWDVLLLHYLGLDHVGHLGGPNSPIMHPKQVEMDQVVDRIFRALEERDRADKKHSLLVLVGDHGMNEIGNHGGSSEPETTAALMIASPTRRMRQHSDRPAESRAKSPYRLHEVVNQIDLVPTLSVLFDLGVPTNSMGKLIESVVAAYGPKNMPSCLERNARQLERVLDAASPGASAGIASQIVGSERLSLEGDVREFILRAQDRLMSTFAESDLRPMVFGLILQASTAAQAPLRTRRTVDGSSSLTCRFLVAATLLVYLGTYFASSFIEEEHEFCFFAAASSLLFLASRPKALLPERFMLIVAAISVRLMRGWSFNGQKSVPNESLTALLAASPQAFSHLLSGFSLLVGAAIPLYSLVRAAKPIPHLNRRMPLSTLFLRALSFGTLATLSLLHAAVNLILKLFSASASSALCDLGLGDPVELSRISFGLGAATWLMARICQSAGSPDARTYKVLQLSAIASTLMTVSRPSNLFLFPILWLQYFLFSNLNFEPLISSFFILLLQRVSFFAFGGSNSLATIDLSNAYAGLRSYSVLPVSLLTYASNFAGPIFFSASSLLPHSTLPYTTTFHSLSLLALCASATHFRQHLSSGPRSVIS
ncbi:BZ3500_MvSof-1268-A1-R1_Chr7-1g09245 [Microbotryum saponariae]|uniref:GPI ethanolamine phosphate transferase 2 n=1 Tax=Microbotryum saponariae TaxID=289078 RepID=A0A2X0LR47_9BASI|nr:BZ3501_MvSof-1269-A2-R1_Chr7-1g08950 [Microbotryum saponariae]SDA03076.1 BZ3500_MvSof-1268-A1-R1_Chr7-1g09245 [Microbotryum saponariae]